MGELEGGTSSTPNVDREQLESLFNLYMVDYENNNQEESNNLFRRIMDIIPNTNDMDVLESIKNEIEDILNEHEERMVVEGSETQEQQFRDHLEQIKSRINSQITRLNQTGGAKKKTAKKKTAKKKTATKKKTAKKKTATKKKTAKKKTAKKKTTTKKKATKKKTTKKTEEKKSTGFFGLFKGGKDKKKTEPKQFIAPMQRLL